MEDYRRVLEDLDTSLEENAAACGLGNDDGLVRCQVSRSRDVVLHTMTLVGRNLADAPPRNAEVSLIFHLPGQSTLLQA